MFCSQKKAFFGRFQREGDFYASLWVPMRAVGVVRWCQWGKDRATITPNSVAKIEQKIHTMQQKNDVLKAKNRVMKI